MTSTIDTNVPEQDSALASAPIRANFAAAANDIDALQNQLLGTTILTATNGHSLLPQSQILTAGAGISIQDNGPGSTLVISAPGSAGTVTSVATGTGLTGGPITTTGTISMASSSADSLAGYDNSGVFSNVTIGSGLSLSGGVLEVTVVDTGITQLTGDVTAGPGSGSQAATLATVNSNIGQFGSATAVSRPTVNAKGLVTAIDTVTIAIPSTAVTDFTEAAQDAVGGIVDSTLVYSDATPSLGRAAITGDVTIAAGSNTAAIGAGVIVNADVNASAGILLSKTNISLTTSGSSGAATLDTTTGVLNIPNYSNASTITVADESADTTCYMGFFTAATGNLQPKTNALIKVDASTGNVYVGPQSTRYAMLGGDGYMYARYDDNSSKYPLKVENRHISLGANGGVGIEFNLANDTINDAITAGRISVVKEQTWTTTASTQDAYFLFSPANDGVAAGKMRLYGSGSLTPNTNDGTALGTSTLSWSDLFLASGGVINFNNGNWVATHSSGILTVGTGDLRVTTAGTNTASVVTVGGTQTLTAKTLTTPVFSGVPTGTVTSGTYTPTLTNATNVAASTTYAAQYMRVGNSVTVSGAVDVDPTSAAIATVLGISLPVASNFSSTIHCCGTAAVGNTEPAARVNANSTSDYAELVFVPTSAASQTWWYQFTYQVI